MRFIVGVVLAAAAIMPARADVECTSAPKKTWMTEAQMRQRIADLGHNVSVFKQTTGNCYEIYGRDSAGKRVEIYFNPVTGAIVRQTTR